MKSSNEMTRIHLNYLVISILVVGVSSWVIYDVIDSKYQVKLSDQYLLGIHKGYNRGYALGLCDGAINMSQEAIEMVKADIINNAIKAANDTPIIRFSTIGYDRDSNLIIKH